jgi:hypothetical protein
MHNRSVQENYERFCAQLSSALNSAADQLPEDLDADRLAETAMGYALLSYAFGLSARRLTSLMHEVQGDGENEKKREHRARKRAEKERKKARNEGEDA